MNLLNDQWAFHYYVNGVIIVFPGSIMVNSDAKTATSNTLSEAAAGLRIICLFLRYRVLRTQGLLVDDALLL